MKYWLGIEIGGTKQQIGIVGDDGSVIKKQSGKPALVRGAQDILDWMESEIPHLTDGYEISGAGIGFGGVLDSGKGTSVCSVQVPGWKDFPIRDRFSEMLSLPCTVVNDTVCGGYAELNIGSGRGKKIFAYTNIGTGCGGSLFVNGRTYNGTGVGGAYFGQIYVPDFVTGKPARMENVCSGTAVAKRLRKSGYIPGSSVLYGKRQDADFRMLCDAVREGDSFACTELDWWAKSYSYAVADILALLSPERISIGGGAANDADLLLPLIRKHTSQLEFLSSSGRYDIVPCETLDDAVFIGAALYARDGFGVIA